jgi:hypothetical protein
VYISTIAATPHGINNNDNQNKTGNFFILFFFFFFFCRAWKISTVQKKELCDWIGGGNTCVLNFAEN